MEAYIGTIFCTETYNAIKMKSFLGSNLILHMLKLSGFLDTLHKRMDVLSCGPNRSLFRKCMAHREKENQTMMTSDCRAVVLQ